MEFLKKNYMKIIIATLMLIGAVFMFLALVMYKKDYIDVSDTDDKLYPLGYLFSYLAGLVFFLGSLAVIALSMFSKTKKISKYTMLGVASVATVLTLLALILTGASTTSADTVDLINKKGDNWTMLSTLYGAEGAEELRLAARHHYFDRMSTLVSYFLVFGIVPLAFAVKKLFCCKCKGGAKAEAKAETKKAK